MWDIVSNLTDLSAEVSTSCGSLDVQTVPNKAVVKHSHDERGGRKTVKAKGPWKPLWNSHLSNKRDELVVSCCSCDLNDVDIAGHSLTTREVTRHFFFLRQLRSNPGHRFIVPLWFLIIVLLNKQGPEPFELLLGSYISLSIALILHGSYK